VVNTMSRNGKANGNNHSLEQGLRLHHLANLGGLVAIAGLDQEPPDLLLGVLLSVAHEVAALTAAQRAQVSCMGRAKLDERATGKRAWKSWTRAQNLHALTLSTSQMVEIITALGGVVPDDPTRIPLVLSQVLTEACDGAA
jgi:hypothetical protein